MAGLGGASTGVAFVIIAVSAVAAAAAPSQTGVRLVGAWEGSDNQPIKERVKVYAATCARTITSRSWVLDLTDFNPASNQGHGAMSVTTNWDAEFNAADGQKLVNRKAVTGDEQRKTGSQTAKYQGTWSIDPNYNFVRIYFRQTNCEGDMCGGFETLDRVFDIYDDGDLMYRRAKKFAPIRFKRRSS